MRCEVEERGSASCRARRGEERKGKDRKEKERKGKENLLNELLIKGNLNFQSQHTLFGLIQKAVRVREEDIKKRGIDKKKMEGK